MICRVFFLHIYVSYIHKIDINIIYNRYMVYSLLNIILYKTIIYFLFNNKL